MKNGPNNIPKNTRKGKGKDTSTPEPIDTFGWATSVPRCNKVTGYCMTFTLELASHGAFLKAVSAASEDGLSSLFPVPEGTCV